MADERLGASFSIDVTKLKAGLAQANRLIRESESEFKAASASMDDFSKSQEGLEAKIKSLNNIQDIQEEKVRALKKQYDKLLQDGVEPTSAQMIKLRTDINNATAAVEKTKKETKNYEDALENLGNEAKKAGEKAEKAEGGFTVMKGAIASLVADGIKSAITAFKELAIEADKAYSVLQAQLGLSETEMQQFQKQMDELYEGNYGDSMEDIANAMAKVAQSTQETDPEKIKELTRNAIALRDTFGFEVNETMRSANMLIDQFGVSGEEAFNLIVQGAQKGLDKNGDLLDTINEYGVHYKQLGYSAEEFLNSLVNGTDAGTFSVDKLGDAMKEFGIRAKDTATTTTDAFSALGYGSGDSEEQVDKLNEQINKLQQNLKYARIEQLNFNENTSALAKVKSADKIAEYESALKKAREQLKGISSSAKNSKGSIEELQKRFASGGEVARDATQEILKELFAMEDEVAQNAVGVGLFGSMWEDLGKDAIKALMDTSGEIDKTSDAMKTLDENKYDNVSHRIQALGRTFKTKLSDSINKNAIPAINEFIDQLEKDKTIDKFADGLTDIAEDVFPPLAKSAKFVAENIEALAGTTLTAITVYKTFQATMKVTSAIKAAQTAVAGLTTGVGLATKAQTALNAVMSKNPIGAVITAVGLLTAGITMLVKSQKKAIEETTYLSKSQQKAVEESKELTTAYKETKEAADKMAQANAGQIDRTKILWKELQTLADESGNVKDADKARVDFILGQLNNALGTEYELNGNIIESYQDIKKSIEDVIRAKKAQLLLDAYQESYTASLKTVSQAEEERAIKAQDLASAQQELVDAEQKLADARIEMQKKFDEATSTNDYRAMSSFTQYMSNLYAEVKKQREVFENKKSAYEEADSTVKQVYENIDSYESASTLILAGETDKAVAILERLGGGYKTAAGVAGESKDEQLRIMQEQVVATEVNLGLLEAEYAKSQGNMTEEEKKQAQNRINAAKIEAKNAKDEYYKVGGNLVEGMARGAEDGEWQLTGSLKSTVNNALEAAKKVLGIKSPSRVFRKQVGLMIPLGIADGVDDGTKQIVKSIKNQSNAIQDAYELPTVAKRVENGLSSKNNIANKSISNTKSVNVYQTNNYSQAHSRYELYKVKQQTLSAVNLAMQ